MSDDKVTIPVNAKPREILAAIDEWATTADYPEQMWTLLTALRGPDDGNELAKELVTVPVRAATLPRLARHAGALYRRDPEYADVHAELATLYSSVWEERVRALVPGISPHFLSHGRRAHAALRDELWS